MKMKKINFKAIVASLAAVSVVASMTAVSASAADTVSIKIDQKTITLEEAKSPVPIYVRMDAVDTGISAFEYGVHVDDRCTFVMVSDIADAMTKGGELINFSMTAAPSKLMKNAQWLTYAASTPYTSSLNMALVMVTLPSDAKAGDQYDIEYIGELGSKEVMRNENDGIDYTASAVDGWIKIEGAPETTTTTAETTTTTGETTTTTGETTTTTGETTTTTGETTTTTGETTTTTGATTTTTGGTTTAKPSTTTTAKPSTTTTAKDDKKDEGSPKTGATDVLPIAGAAAAVAVLGGVALVVKKKND